MTRRRLKVVWGVMLLEDNSDHEHIDHFFGGLNIYGWSNTHCQSRNYI
jgi:hypothetical protein